MGTADDAIGLARQLLEAFNGGNRDQFGSLLTDDVVQVEPGGATFNGPKEVTANMWSYRNTFPDLQATVTDAFGSGDKAALEVTFAGTYEPYTYGKEAKRVTSDACMVAVAGGERISRFTIYIDRLAMLDQLEDMPLAPESPPPGFIYHRLAGALHRKEQ